jgi:hypothetical protein
MAREIGIYKATRATISGAAGSLLTAQAAPENGPAWDVLQESTRAHDQIVLSAVQSDGGGSPFNVKPTELQPEVIYDVQSVDTGELGSATGAALMSGGIDIVESPNSAAHILIVTARQD